MLQKVTAGLSTELDEAATVERIADEGVWLPVLKPALEPWLDLALVVDESLSMQLWHQTIAELQRLLSHYGVFRDVRVWSLVTNDEGQIALLPRVGAASRRKTAHRLKELVDPGGRRLILVATDCVDAIWQNGSMLPALKLWAESGPMAIMQMLPEWLWVRTGLGFASSVKLHSLMPGVPNQQLNVRNLSPWDEVDLETGIRVPVLTLEPEPFLVWSKMVSAKGGNLSPGFVFEPEGTASLDGASRQTLLGKETLEQRLQQFRTTASPMARRLAGFLAASPIISLPMVRIIQDRLLPQSRQVHIAEVFLGGLLKPLSKGLTNEDRDLQLYNFLDEARSQLLESVPTSDSINVLNEVSDFISRKLGLSVNDFTVLLKSPEQIESNSLAIQLHLFAVVSAQILRQLGGEYKKLAEELENNYADSHQYSATPVHNDTDENQKSSSDDFVFSLAIDRLTQADSNHYAIWVLESPFPGGYAHHDRLWDGQMAQIWESWQQFFSLRALPPVPHVPSAYVPQFHLDDLPERVSPIAESSGYTGRLMQGLGVSLWEWLFDGPIRQTLERSLGMAIGQNRLLKLRLEVRPPELISLPWEIMQPEPGCPALSLGPQILFSRTTSAVEPLPEAELETSLRILLVLGCDRPGDSANPDDSANRLQLPQEAEALKQLLELSASSLSYRGSSPVVCQVQTLVEPDAKTLLTALETGYFNVFFYAGHGVPAPDGGLLLLQPGQTLSGTDLAQGLARNGIRLTVFNTCWATQPDLQQQQAIPRSSLVEVLLQLGVPAVLTMRDSFADEEAQSFIQVLARELAARKPVELAVALARNHLLTTYRFNHPAWTLPVLYQHPQFEGRLLR